MKKFIYFIIAVLGWSILSCKKESNQTAANSLLIGLWQYDLTTITHYDSSDNIKEVDTITYVDNVGHPVTPLEKYDIDNHFYFFGNSVDDTLVLSSTYTKSGNNLVINEPDSIYEWNNRTITQLDNSNLEVFQYYSNQFPKIKWTSRYHRK